MDEILHQASSACMDGISAMCAECPQLFGGLGEEVKPDLRPEGPDYVGMQNSE